MSTFEDAKKRLKNIMQKNNIHKEVQERLMHPKLAIEVSIPVRMDDGDLKVFTGFRVQYDNSRGPCKGGIRFHPNVCYDEVASLSLWMAIKCAAAGIPYGGGKGGVTVNPKELSLLELERLSRGYMRSIRDIVGEDRDIPAPDVNTNATIMGWMLDEYQNITRRHVPSVITGKPIELGGSKGRTQATGEGGLYALNLWLKRNNINPKETTVAIQGFGNVGYHFARLAKQEGYNIVAVTDSKGGIYHKEGLDPDKLMEHKAKKKPVHSLYCNESLTCETGFKHIDNNEILELDVDVLVPAALENVITKVNADNIKAKHILELANGPVDTEAEDILYEKGVNIIPDVYANAGGVVVSYFEWLQGKSGYYWEADEVSSKLKEIMDREGDACFDIALDNNVSLRDAVYRHALMRIEKAMTSRGTKEYFESK